jgi:protein-S-isoprenylcysteine O-methyltransferase Ste14
MKKRNILPPTYFYAAITIMVALNFLFPIMKIIPSPWHWTALIPLACGALLNLIADQSFRKAGTTVKPYIESTALITDGVFRISRHPMYLGFVLILIGVAVFMRSLSPFLVIPVFGYLMDWIYISVEERMLADKFGQVWSNYTSKVRRWL